VEAAKVGLEECAFEAGHRGLRYRPSFGAGIATLAFMLPALICMLMPWTFGKPRVGNRACVDGDARLPLFCCCCCCCDWLCCSSLALVCSPIARGRQRRYRLISCCELLLLLLLLCCCSCALTCRPSARGRQKALLLGLLLLAAFAVAACCSCCGVSLPCNATLHQVPHCCCDATNRK